MNDTRAVVPHAVVAVTSDPRRALVCADCGRTVPCPAEEVEWYAESGWPRCCGEVMSLGDVFRPGAVNRMVLSSARERVMPAR